MKAMLNEWHILVKNKVASVNFAIFSHCSQVLSLNRARKCMYMFTYTHTDINSHTYRHSLKKNRGEVYVNITTHLYPNHQVLFFTVGLVSFFFHLHIYDLPHLPSSLSPAWNWVSTPHLPFSTEDVLHILRISLDHIFFFLCVFLII